MKRGQTLRKLSSDEIEAFSSYSRQINNWSPGVLAYIKRTYSKRVRRAAKREIAAAGGDQLPG